MKINTSNESNQLHINRRLTVDQALSHRWLHIDDLQNRDLSRSAQELRSYRARHHFRSAVKAVMAVNMFRRMGEHYHKADLDKQAASLLPSMLTATTSADTSIINESYKDSGDQENNDNKQIGRVTEIIPKNDVDESIGDQLFNEEHASSTTLTTKSCSSLSLCIPAPDANDWSDIISPHSSSLLSHSSCERSFTSLTESSAALVDTNSTKEDEIVIESHKRRFDSITSEEEDNQDGWSGKKLKAREERGGTTKKNTSLFGCIWG